MKQEEHGHTWQHIPSLHNLIEHGDTQQHMSSLHTLIEHGDTQQHISSLHTLMEHGHTLQAISSLHSLIFHLIQQVTHNSRHLVLKLFLSDTSLDKHVSCNQFTIMSNLCFRSLKQNLRQPYSKTYLVVLLNFFTSRMLCYTPTQTTVHSEQKNNKKDWSAIIYHSQWKFFINIYFS